MIEIQKLVSLPPLNSYAPTWDISIGVATWEEEEKIDKLNQYLLKKEKEINLQVQKYLKLNRKIM